MANMWMVRAGPDSFLIDDFKKHNLVAIGWNIGDLSDKSRDEIKTIMTIKYRNRKKVNKALSQVTKFVYDLKIGDYVITSDNDTRTYFLGKITSDYYRSDKISKVDEANDNYWDMRDVEWLGEISKDSLKKATQKTLGSQGTVYNINDNAKTDILNVYGDNMKSIDNAAEIIRNYLDENNLGNFENKDNEYALIKFRRSFTPEILKNLQGIDIINKIFSHDEDKNNLCYALEFSKEYLFAGSIAGGSAFKFSLFKRKTTGEWTAGSPRKPRIVSEIEAIEIGSKIRDAIVDGAELIENYSLNSVSDYVRLEKDLEKIFSNCDTSPLTQWIHKYYVLIFPDKFPVVHWDEMKKDFLNLFGITPQKGYYALDGQLQLLTKKSGIKCYSLFNKKILELFGNPPHPPQFISDLKRNIIYFGAPEPENHTI